MRKYIVFVLSLLLLVSMAGCSNADKQAPAETDSIDESLDASESAESDALEPSGSDDTLNLPDEAIVDTTEEPSSDGTPLTQEELDWFTEYTASTKTEYDEENDLYVGSATEISCFFTSQYSDPRDMDAEEFLRYCPEEATLGEEDEEEFALVQEKLDYRGGEDDHLLTVTEMPTPCHRLPRSYINEILTKYAGITVEEMNTDWFTEAFYIPETDCFYTCTSDFGPGFFIPSYGEKSGDTVTLWSDKNGENKSYALVLQEVGEDWHILSYGLAA
jgi:hypothetical protein